MTCNSIAIPSGNIVNQTSTFELYQEKIKQTPIRVVGTKREQIFIQAIVDDYLFKTISRDFFGKEMTYVEIKLGGKFGSNPKFSNEINTIWLSELKTLRFRGWYFGYGIIPYNHIVKGVYTCAVLVQKS